MSQRRPLPVPAVAVAPELASFWSATTQGRLLLPRCQVCGLVFWHPRLACPDCAGTDVAFIEASGEGTVYSYTVNRRPPAPYDPSDQLVVAYVALAEGPCVLTNLVGCEPDEISIGKAVEVVFDKAQDNASVYRFRPSRTRDAQTGRHTPVTQPPERGSAADHTAA